MKKTKQKNGFTLFEMLVVISIIAILTAVISINFSSAQKKARDSKRQQDMKAIQTAAEQYYSMSNYEYPKSANSGDWKPASGQPVLDLFPKDPKGTGWTAYVYNPGTTYCACAAMENVSNGNSTDDKCAFGTGVTGPYFCVKNQQ
jgi:prepilin-type N-terminal cleavage/methylation domain-containing protein